MDPKAAMEFIEAMFRQAREHGVSSEDKAELSWVLEGLSRWIAQGGFLTDKDK